MTDFYLNLPDAATFEGFKGVAPFEYDESGSTQSAGWNIDILGEGNKRATSWDSEGEPSYTPLEGFLINLRSSYELPEALKQYVVHPTSPLRVWA